MLSFFEPDSQIILVSESSLIKTVTNIQALTKTITNFDVVEKEAQSLTDTHPNITVILDSVIKINTVNNAVETKSCKVLKYDYLCICTGGRPKLIPQALDNKYVVGIRDTDSVDEFVEKLSKTTKIVIVGNGGIASEIIHKIRNVEVHWVIKDKHITATFVDPGAATFFQDSLNQTTPESSAKQMRYKEDGPKSGAALGPNWYQNLEIYGALSKSLPDNIKIHYESEIIDLTCDLSNPHPVKVTLSNGLVIDSDLVVSATGVVPHHEFEVVGSNLAFSEDRGIVVNEFLQTTVANIYAAGDVCSPTWQYAKHWFPMKLWTQARQMGCYAARSMCANLNKEEILQDFCFEIFTHSTKLFGYKVILLGLYNGQKLGQDYEILLRMTKGHEYIKFVIQEGKLHGAILIGETDLEETCENLILNQIDISPYGTDILNPDIDIEDYFD
ncbi:hypothetical protein PPYR_09529 [Photinus pyralis]|nr:hypothetical protein PPYR_09529 [Photinus pyralis]